MEPLTARISTFDHLPDFCLAEFCSDLLANEIHFLQLEDREEQTSSVQHDLGGCLLVVGLQGVVFTANF